jgi:hypothetical protein
MSSLDRQIRNGLSANITLNTVAAFELLLGDACQRVNSLAFVAVMALLQFPG